uniref:Putative secreted protein ovary overexpressed n=1 Tax=Rhipicephalus microplus TaxID=6941 RepID=A0A6M2DBS9_RHIMP
MFCLLFCFFFFFRAFVLALIKMQHLRSVVARFEHCPIWPLHSDGLVFKPYAQALQMCRQSAPSATEVRNKTMSNINGT